MERREREALDRHITGNYGEDQFRDEMEEVEMDIPDPCMKCSGVGMHGEGCPTQVIDISTITPQEYYEVGRRAVEDFLIEMRDMRCGLLGRNNGLVVNEADGTPSDIIRMAIEHAIEMGIRAIVEARANA